MLNFTCYKISGNGPNTFIHRYKNIINSTCKNKYVYRCRVRIDYTEAMRFDFFVLRQRFVCISSHA